MVVEHVSGELLRLYKPIVTTFAKPLPSHKIDYSSQILAVVCCGPEDIEPLLGLLSEYSQPSLDNAYRGTLSVKAVKTLALYYRLSTIRLRACEIGQI